MRLFRTTSTLFLILLSVLLMFVPSYSAYMDREVGQGLPSYRDAPDTFPTIVPSLYPERLVDVRDPDVSAEGVFVIDVDSAVPLFSKQSDLVFYPASTTKIMTALVSLDSYSLDSIVSVKEASTSGSNMKLQLGERISVENLMYGLMVNSGNDAAEVLATYFPTGRDGFISRMNEKARELGLRSTYFMNPSGLPLAEHVTTPWDLGHLSAFAMRDARFRKYVSVRERTVFGVTGERHILKSTNKLLGVIPGVDGVKTGYTEEAGEVLVTSVVRNDRRVIIVLLKSSDRFGETSRIIDWVYANHTWKTFSR